jgi:hypothetical protein
VVAAKATIAAATVALQKQNRFGRFTVLNRDSPDGVSIGAFPSSLQYRREVWTDTGHYAQRPRVPHEPAEHMAAPTNAANVKKVLASSEPSPHGTKRTC